MKHLNSLIIVVLSVFTVTAGLNAEEISHRYHFDTPTVKHMDGYSEICIPGTRNLGIPGDPLLPAKGVYLLLPPGQCVGQVEIIPGERITLPGSFDIRPAEREYPLSYRGPFVPTPPNTEIYNSDKPYPGKLLRSYTTQFLCGYNIAILGIYPVEYIPAKGELAHYSSLEVRITTATSEKSRNATANFLQTTPQVQARVRRIVDNPEDISRYGFGEGMGGEEIDYVIITSDGLSASFETLREFKNRRGIRTVIKTIEEIYTKYSGIDDQDKIRNFIIDAYQNWNTEYVLLGGDDNIIPHRGFYATAYTHVDNDIPADIYYGALDGNWNDDGDSHWGEPGEEDFYTEVFVGRAAIETATEADNFINKVIMYQQNPVINECTEALMVGELLWSWPWLTWGGDYKDEIKNGSDAWGYTTVGFPDWFNVETLYDRDLGYEWSAMNDLLPLLNDGVSIVNHLGHSWIDYVMRFYDYQITDDNFTNNGTNHSFYIIYTQGCYPNAFDHEAISERFTGIQNGAVAFVGNTRYGWGSHGNTNGSSQYFDRQFFDALFGEDIYNIGQTNDDSKIDNIWAIYTVGGAIRWCYYQLCLIGDPQMPIWTEVPETLTVNHNPVCLVGSDQFDVLVPGVEGALVGLFKDGELLGRAYTNAVGAATVFFDVIPLSPGEMDVTVTAHNYLPYQAVVEVIPPEGPYVILHSFEIDDSLGNNNGVVNPGETIAMPLTLKNVGVETAFNVSATLSTADSFVTITDSVKFFGHIDSAGIGTSVGDYVFEVASTCPDQHVILFDVSITADGSYEWNSSFTVEVLASDIATSSDTLNFGEVYIDYPESLLLTVFNLGSEILSVTDIHTDTTDFSVDITSFSLGGGESQDVMVGFSPSYEGIISGTLFIMSDDPDEPIVTVALLGEGLVEPDISVSPDSLSDSLLTGNTSMQLLTIYNTADTGCSDLDFYISIGQASTSTSISLNARSTGSIINHPSVPRRSGKDHKPPVGQGSSYPLFERMVSNLSKQNAIFFDDMESGVNGWTKQLYGGATDDLWHQTDLSYNSPVTSWWCGIEGQGDYETGNQINTAVISPPIDLSIVTAPITLEFFESYHTEGGYDYCMVDVSTNGGGSWTPLRGDYGSAPSGNSGGWIMSVLDLSDFEGEVIQIRFYFDTGDELYNDYPGWFFDDVLVMAEGVPWLFVYPTCGTVASGDSIDIAVTFDATGLNGGDYFADIIITSNDPDEDTVTVPAHLHVTGAPDIAVSEDTLDYGIVFLGFSVTDTLIVSNIGTDLLTVSNIFSDNSDYTLDTTSFILPPGGNQDVLVTFTPSTTGQILGTLIIESDDPDTPILAISLQGESAEAPDISVAPDSLHECLFTDSISTQMLTIYNTADPGASDLTFNISIEFSEQGDWLTVDTWSGTIPAGDSLDVSVTFDATGLDGGIYDANIVISSDDPDEPEVIIPVGLFVRAYEWTTSELSWSPGATAAGWHGWWFRHGTEWFQFTFTGIDTTLIDSQVRVGLYLSVTNRMSGERGLDGLIDVVVNPGLTPTTTYTDVLLDNVDPNNLVCAHNDPAGSSRAPGQIIVPKSYIVDGQLIISVERHTDNNNAPTAPIGTEQPIDTSTTPPTVPPGVYENDNAHTVHMYVWCQDGSGGHIVTSEHGWGYVSITSDMCPPIRGDANRDCVIELSDAVYLINYLFKGGPAPDPLWTGDVNCDDVVDLGDVIYLINYLYRGGPPPCEGKATISQGSGLDLYKGKAAAQIGLSSPSISKDSIFDVPVIGKFDVDLAAIQLEIKYDPEKITLLEPVLTPRTEGMTIYSSAAEGTQKIGILNLGGEHYIPAGSGALVDLRMKGSDLSSLKIAKAILVDRDAQKIPVQIASVTRNSEEDFTARRSAIPQEFSLSQNYPNPFNPQTEISYALPNGCHVELSIYNLLGQKVRTVVDEYQAAGHKTVHWDGKNEEGNRVASGIYFYQIQAGEMKETRKMILMK